MAGPSAAEHSFHQATRRIGSAPLVPVALALTAGILLDRYAEIPVTFSLAGSVLALVSWAAAARGRAGGLALVYLMGAVVALGAAYHQARRTVYRADDVGNHAQVEPAPARILGRVVEAPVVNVVEANDALQSFPREEASVLVVRALRLRGADDWQPASGLVRVHAAGVVTGLRVGDTIEVVGRLTLPDGPANPGELDYASFLQDQGIRAQLSVRHTPEALTLVERGWPASPPALLVAVRGWGRETLTAALPEQYAGLAAALLLGDGAAMTRDDWDRYIRTGVVHILAISGQHLVILAWIGWLVLRVANVRRARGGWVVALCLLAYALVAGGRPPVLRSAVMVCTLSGGWWLRKPLALANTFALAWIIVLALNPSDLFNAGCQLSFLTVAVLYWFVGRWASLQTNPLTRLIRESRPAWERGVRWLGRQVLLAYAITATCWLAAAPLVAARYHMVSLTGVLISPPVVLLSGVALLAGFLLLLAAAVCWPLVPLLAWVVQAGLAGCEFLVRGADRLGWVHYTADVPQAWLIVLYLGLLSFLVLEALHRRWDLSVLALLGWLCVGFVAAGTRLVPDELRCTFLAVGHGGCTVLETPEGRTLLYDAGAITGPDVTRRHIAPYLWHRGIRRIDELFLSHADLDHFNGVAGLAERFPIAQVTCTPSFAAKTTPGVAATLEALDRRRIPVRVVRAGDRLASGPLTLDVLHPPDAGPDGPENARSLVLLVQHAGHRLLLTGDLEKAGLERVLGLSAPPVDVLMAPHHGSRAANTPELAEWAKPRLVVANQGPPRWPAHPNAAFRARAIPVLGTWPYGAITLHSGDAGLWLETMRASQPVRVR